MYKLKIITSTVREGRKGPLVAAWVAEQLKENTDFEIEVLELGEINLPLCTEPYHPSLHKYLHPSTIHWGQRIAEADAFMFVLAEYNHSYPAPIKNAIDTLGIEWAGKPVGFVTYGGIAGGTRSMSAILPSLTINGLVPITSKSVNFPYFEQYIDEQTGVFDPGERSSNFLKVVVGELSRWVKILAPYRANS